MQLGHGRDENYLSLYTLRSRLALCPLTSRFKICGFAVGPLENSGLLPKHCILLTCRDRTILPSHTVSIYSNRTCTCPSFPFRREKKRSRELVVISFGHATVKMVQRYEDVSITWWVSRSSLYQNEPRFVPPQF
jgi:hypothetical protein